MAITARQSLEKILHATLSPIAQLPPFVALIRAEFEHRQRRHTSMVSQCIERDRRAITHFLDTELSEFALRIPYDSFHGKKLKRMIRNHLPSVAAIPYAGTAQPPSDTPVKAAIHWRLEKILQRLPRLRRHLQKRSTFFRFHDGVIKQRHYFAQRTQVLQALEPVLKSGKAGKRLQALLEGRLSPADQACALLPPALFMRELNRRLTDAWTRAS